MRYCHWQLQTQNNATSEQQATTWGGLVVGQRREKSEATTKIHRRPRSLPKGRPHRPHRRRPRPPRGRRPRRRHPPWPPRSRRRCEATPPHGTPAMAMSIARGVPCNTPRTSRTVPLTHTDTFFSKESKQATEQNAPQCVSSAARRWSRQRRPRRLAQRRLGPQGRKGSSRNSSIAANWISQRASGDQVTKRSRPRRPPSYPRALKDAGQIDLSESVSASRLSCNRPIPTSHLGAAWALGRPPWALRDDRAPPGAPPSPALALDSERSPRSQVEDDIVEANFEPSGAARNTAGPNGAQQLATAPAASSQPPGWGAHAVGHLGARGWSSFRPPSGLQTSKPRSPNLGSTLLGQTRPTADLCPRGPNIGRTRDQPGPFRATCCQHRPTSTDVAAGWPTSANVCLMSRQCRPKSNPSWPPSSIGPDVGWGVG